MKQALYVAWRTRDRNSPAWGPVGCLEFDAGIYRFFYTRGAKTLSGFPRFPQMDDLYRVYESEELFPLFKNRLLSKRRPEYEDYLRWSGFSFGELPEPLALLAVTEGQRQTDAIEVFPCPQQASDGCYLNRFFLHGVRWISDTGREYLRGKLDEGENLKLVPEPENTYDRMAVAVYDNDGQVKLGYAPRYLAKEIRTLQDKCGLEAVTLSAYRLNRDAPLQQYVLCQMHACWPDGFEPCQGEAFRPLPIDIAERCPA